MLNTNRQTKELKVANKISDAVNDLTLDLEQIGIYLAGNNNTTYRRIMIVSESAQHEREGKVSEDYI